MVKIQIVEYENKERKARARAVDIESLLEDMNYLENFVGVTKEKIVEHYYSIKRQLLEGLQAQKKQ